MGGQGEYCYFPDKVNDKIVIFGEIGTDFLVVPTEVDKDREGVFGDGLTWCQSLGRCTAKAESCGTAWATHRIIAYE